MKNITYEERIKNALKKPSLTRYDLLHLYELRLYDNEGGIDVECLELCVALNKLNGITTFESCCGHETGPFQIWFVSQSMEALATLMEILSHHGSHSQPSKWKVYCPIEYWPHKRELHPASFILEGPVGAYDQANEITNLINSYIERKDIHKKEN